MTLDLSDFNCVENFPFKVTGFESLSLTISNNSTCLQLIKHNYKYALYTALETQGLAIYKTCEQYVIIKSHTSFLQLAVITLTMQHESDLS